MKWGTLPAAAVNPVVAAVMKEREIDISANRPKTLTMQMVNDVALVVTMGRSIEKICPAPIIGRMQKKLVDWNLEDPKGKPIGKVRQIRDEIERKVAELQTAY